MLCLKQNNFACLNAQHRVRKLVLDAQTIGRDVLQVSGENGQLIAQLGQLSLLTHQSVLQPIKLLVDD